MVKRMMIKFSKYWNDYSVILAIGAILDPRMKFDALRFCYSNTDTSTCEEKLNYIKSQIYMLFEEYAKGSPNDSCATSSQTPSSMQHASYVGKGKGKAKNIFGVSYLFFQECIYY